MTGSEKNQLRFDISEKVRLHPHQPGIGTLLELDLYPDVEIEDQKTHLKIQGYLRLNGVYLAEREHQPISEEEGGLPEATPSGQREEIAYVIPVEITLPTERVDMDHIASEVQSFDYQVLSPFELQIEALLTVDGFIQDLEDEREEEEESVEVVPAKVATFSVPPQGEEGWELDSPPEVKAEQDEYEFVHVARLDGEEKGEAEAGDAEEGTEEEVEEQEEAEEKEEAAPAEERTGAERVSLRPRREEEAEQSPTSGEQEEPEAAGEEREEEGSVSPIPFQPYLDREAPPLSQQFLRSPHLGEFDFQNLSADERERFGGERLPEGEPGAQGPPEEEMPEEEAGEEPEEGEQEQEAEQEGTSLEWAKWLLREEKESVVKLKMVIVHRDDSLDTLAQRYETSAKQIVRLNRLESEVLEEGQVVYIPSN